MEPVVPKEKEEDAVFSVPLQLNIYSEDLDYFGSFSRAHGAADLRNRTAAQMERLELLQKEAELFDEKCVGPLREAEERLVREMDVIRLQLSHLGRPKESYEHALNEMKERFGKCSEAEASAWPPFPSEENVLKARLAVLEEWQDDLLHRRCEFKMQRDAAFHHRYQQVLAGTPRVENQVVEALVTCCEQGDLLKVMHLVHILKGREDLEEGWVNVEDQPLGLQQVLGGADSSGARPLHAACASGNVELVSYLLLLGADPLALDEGDGYAPVHWAVWGACSHPWEDVMSLLLRHGAIHVLSREGRSPLHLACYVGNLDVVNWLLDHGMLLTQRETMFARRTPLHIASWRGFPRIVSALLDKGANPRHPTNRNGESAVLEAVLCKHEHVLRCFLSHGFWLSAKEMDFIRVAFQKDAEGVHMLQRVLRDAADKCGRSRSSSQPLQEDRWRSVTVLATSASNPPPAETFSRQRQPSLSENEGAHVDSEALYALYSPHSAGYSSVAVDDDSDTREGELGQIDWNEEYQRRRERVRNASHGSMEERIASHQSFAHFGAAFLDQAVRYGSVILSEMHIPDHRKSIKAVEGGFAGGQKYLVQNLYFKLALDDKDLYANEPCWMNAPAKVAGLDLKGLVSYSSCDAPLSFPAMIVLDFLGERLTCMSAAPITSSTLVFGSSDGGQTSRNADTLIAEYTARCAKELNLATYLLDSGATVATFDLEGHVGTDGRRYLLDYSRSMPCDTNVSVKEFPSAPLYQLLRPELVRSHVKPLCPDAFSQPFRANKGPAGYRTDVQECSTRLLGPSLEQLVQDLKRTPNIPHVDVVCLMHEKGVNCRYLGHLYARLSEHQDCSYWAHRVVEEAVARCIKTDIRLGWRILMRNSGAGSSLPCISFAVKRLNEYFGSKGSGTVWDESLLALLVKKFRGAVDGFPKSKFRAWYLANAYDHDRKALCSLFTKVVHVLGLRLSQRAERYFSQSDQHFDTAAPLLQLDIEALEPVVKTAPMLHLSQAVYLKTLLSQSRDGRVAQQAMRHYEAVLRSQPSNAQAWAELGDLCLLQKEMARAEFCIERAVAASPQDPDILCKYGKLLWYQRDRHGAHVQWAKALDPSPNHEATLACMRIFSV